MQSARIVSKVISSVTSCPAARRSLGSHAHDYGKWAGVAKKEIVAGLGLAFVAGFAWKKVQVDRKDKWSTFYDDVAAGKVSTTNKN